MQAVDWCLTVFVQTNELSLLYRMKCLHYCADFCSVGLWGVHIMLHMYSNLLNEMLTKCLN